MRKPNNFIVDDGSDAAKTQQSEVVRTVLSQNSRVASQVGICVHAGGPSAIDDDPFVVIGGNGQVTPYAVR